MSLSQTLSTSPSHQPHSPAPGNKQALISLSDKKDLDILGTGLQQLGYTIVSTGGTATALEKAAVSVTKVEQLTRFPEMLDGRVKTLHPNIHGGILARRDQKHHMEALNEHGIGIFDVVVVNLYPFYVKVTSAGGIDFEDGIENIDIGGPAMIRAAAKKTILHSWNISREVTMINSFVDSLLGKLLNMLLLMILQFQSGCGNRLGEINFLLALQCPSRSKALFDMVKILTRRLHFMLTRVLLRLMLVVLQLLFSIMGRRCHIITI